MLPVIINYTSIGLFLYFGYKCRFGYDILLNVQRCKQEEPPIIGNVTQNFIPECNVRRYKIDFFT